MTAEVERPPPVHRRMGDDGGLMQALRAATQAAQSGGSGVDEGEDGGEDDGNGADADARGAAGDVVAADDDEARQHAQHTYRMAHHLRRRRLGEAEARHASADDPYGELAARLFGPM